MLAPASTSPTDTARIVSRPLTVRSRASNTLHRLEGVSGKSSAGRRFRDLVESFVANLGPAALTESEKAQVRTAAALTLRVEALQAQIGAGHQVDDEQMIRLVNSQGRALKGLERMARRKQAAKHPLADYLASKGAT